MKLVDRFLQYVKFDTQSDELTNLTPSTPGQMVFAQELKKELEGMGLSDISLDENGYLMATLPSNTDKKVPTIGFIAPDKKMINSRRTGMIIWIIKIPQRLHDTFYK